MIGPNETSNLKIAAPLHFTVAYKYPQAGFKPVKWSILSTWIWDTTQDH